MAYFERFLSRRYLFSSEKKALLSAITIIAVLGVAIGVASLVIVLGVMDGAEKDLFGKVISIYPHVKIARANHEQIEDAGRIVEIAKRIPGVELVEPVISKESLFSSRLDSAGELVAGQLVGVERLGDSPLYKIHPAPGNPEISELKEREVLLGKPLAEKLGVKPGDTILRITGLTGEKTNRRAPSGRLTVAGIFETGYYAFDSLSAIISAETARKTFGQDQIVDYVHVKLTDPLAVADYRVRWWRFVPVGIETTTEAQRVAELLQLELGPAFTVLSWEDENGAFFQSLAIQKLALFLILMLIILVAGFNIIGTLILMVIEKTREIGILKAIGGSDRMIRRAFLYTGSIIGFLGTLTGVAFGLLGCWLLTVYKFQMPPSVYNFDHLPVLVKPLTVVIIVASAMGVCTLASLLPAIQAARLDPVEALRHE